MVPDFIAVCVPFIFGTFKKPAEQPMIAPPGKTGYGIDWNLTSIIIVSVLSYIILKSFYNCEKKCYMWNLLWHDVHDHK